MAHDSTVAPSDRQHAAGLHPQSEATSDASAVRPPDTVAVSVKIEGLCLYVTDEDDVHVLLLRNDAEAHIARIYSDALLVPGTSGAPKYADLHGAILSFKRPGKPGGRPWPPRHGLTDLADLSGKDLKLSRRQLTGGAGGRVQGRITLPANSFRGVRRPSHWCVPIGERNGSKREILLTNRTFWSFENVPVAALNAAADDKEGLWMLASLAGGAQPSKGPALDRPSQGGRTIDLHIVNLPDRHLPRGGGHPHGGDRLTQQGDDAEHFESYYQLLGVNDPVIPKFLSNGDGPNADLPVTLPDFIGKGGCDKLPAPGHAAAHAPDKVLGGTMEQCVQTRITLED